MIQIGTPHPLAFGIEVRPDTIVTLKLAANAAQAFDMPSDANLMRLTGMTTANARLNFFANLSSTGAAVPSSGQTTDSSGIQQPVLGERYFQIPGGSTGFSLIAESSGYVIAEFWKR